MTFDSRAMATPQYYGCTKCDHFHPVGITSCRDGFSTYQLDLAHPDGWEEVEEEAGVTQRKIVGFDVWNTGGNCTALGRNLDNGRYVLITNEASVPLVGEEFVVGIYNENLGGEEEIAYAEFSADATDGDVYAFILTHTGQ